MSKSNETSTKSTVHTPSLLDQELLKSVLHERNHLKDPLQFAAWKSRLEQALLGTGSDLASPQALSLGKLCVHYTIHNQLDPELKSFQELCASLQNILGLGDLSAAKLLPKIYSMRLSIGSETATSFTSFDHYVGLLRAGGTSVTSADELNFLLAIVDNSPEYHNFSTNRLIYSKQNLYEYRTALIEFGQNQKKALANRVSFVQSNKSCGKCKSAGRREAIWTSHNASECRIEEIMAKGLVHALLIKIDFFAGVGFK